jgi:murein DD-endopeptidase MepM/ murein hydrolase activator NlpD
MLSPGRQAGIVVALSTLAVVTSMAVGETFRTAPPTLAVAGAASLEVPVKASLEAEPTTSHLLFPVRGFDQAPLRDTFNDKRGVRRHQALDIFAPRGTPVVAVDDGRIARLLRNPLGGITLYQIDVEEKRIYYYAHLDRYAAGIFEGMDVRRGDILGYVGSTGNAPARSPHLHFAIHELGGDKRWWKGKPVDPYPLLKAE